MHEGNVKTTKMGQLMQLEGVLMKTLSSCTSCPIFLVFALPSCIPPNYCSQKCKGGSTLGIAGASMRQKLLAQRVEAPAILSVTPLLWLHYWL